MTVRAAQESALTTSFLFIVTSEVEKRRQQIGRELDRVRLRLAQKTAGRYPSEAAYKYQQRRARELVADLEGELSALECPGEFDELPGATVADEIGLTSCQVRNLIKSGEIEATGNAGHERISRAEMERIGDLGVTELLRLSRQESTEIFDETVPYLQNGNLELSGRAYRRLNARGAWRGPHAPAFLVGLEVAKGEFDNALFSVKLIHKMTNPLEREATTACLEGLLRGMRLECVDAQTFAQQLLTVVKGNPAKGGIFNKIAPEQRDEKIKGLQQRALYLATAIDRELRKYQPRRVDIEHKLSSALPTRKFNLLLRSALYTALYAESTHEESAASKMYIETIQSTMPTKYRPATLLGKLCKKQR
jgi:hypothetical protein